MNFFVGPQSCTLCESLVAHIAPVRFFTRVNPFVNAKVACLRELPFTLIASERPFAGVNSGMRQKMSPLRKNFAARFAKVRRLAGMGLLVEL